LKATNLPPCQNENCWAASLKAYRLNPARRRCVALRARFDRIFLRRTGFVTLDRLLARLHANKDELLMVLEWPEIPLHTNGSENDIRCHVTRRKVSAGTRSDVGRDCRDAFLGLAKTCDEEAQKDVTQETERHDEGPSSDGAQPIVILLRPASSHFLH
jgi:hypothetical protein